MLPNIRAYLDGISSKTCLRDRERSYGRGPAACLPSALQQYQAFASVHNVCDSIFAIDEPFPPEFAPKIKKLRKHLNANTAVSPSSIAVLREVGRRAERQAFEPHGKIDFVDVD